MKSGLVVEKSNTPGMGSLYIVYNGSAMKEASGHRGLSHLWEHLKCHSYEDLNEKLLASGITTNAYTSDNNVVFYWKGLDDQIELYQNRLLNLVSYVPTMKQFLNEKKIVLQEYDDAASRQNFIFANITRKYFDYYGPIGCRKDVEEITYESFLEFAKNNFANPVQIIRIGNSTTIEDDTKDITYFDNSLTIGLTAIEIPTDVNVENPSTFGSSLLADWIKISKADISYNMLTLIVDALSSGLSSPLYKEIREANGLVYHCGMYLDSSDLYDNVIYFTAGCAHDNIQKVRDIVTEIMTNIHTYVSKERFESIVEMSKNSLRISEIENYKTVNKYFDDDYSSFSIQFLKEVEYEQFKKYTELFSKLYLKNVKFGYSDSEINI